MTVQLPSAAQISPGPITVTDNVNPANPAFTLALPSLSGAASGTGAVIQSGAQISSSNSLTLATTGDVRVASGAHLFRRGISPPSAATSPSSGQGLIPGPGW